MTAAAINSWGELYGLAHRDLQAWMGQMLSDCLGREATID